MMVQLAGGLTAVGYWLWESLSVLAICNGGSAVDRYWSFPESRLAECGENPGHILSFHWSGCGCLPVIGCLFLGFQTRRSEAGIPP